MSYDTPLTPQGQELANLPVREQLRRGFKDMGSRSFSSAKNFGLVGAMFAGTECCIEGVGASFRGVAVLLLLLKLPKLVVSSKERYEEWPSGGVYYGWYTRSESRSPGCCRWMRRLCSFQCRYRLLVENAFQQLIIPFARLTASTRT